jgi:hypothetical protein
MAFLGPYAVRLLSGSRRRRPQRGHRPRREQLRELPGYQAFGEGILLVLDPDAVAAWEAEAARSERLRAAAAAVVRQSEPVQPLRWLLAHTLAHLTDHASCRPQAGYPLPALQERIYATDQRTAALIYTAADDVQGTLGGLEEAVEARLMVRLPPRAGVGEHPEPLG